MKKIVSMILLTIFIGGLIGNSFSYAEGGLESKGTNLRIKGIEIYHPSNKINNNFYIEHFKKQGKDISRLLKAFGREDRYIINDKEENALTMAQKVCLKVLKSCDLSGSDVDLLVFSTQTPEYSLPANAMALSGMINVNANACIFDINQNCSGMVMGTDVVRSLMAARPDIKYALLVGSENWSAFCSPENEYTYPIFGDMACAVVFEKSEDDSSKFYDSTYITNGENALKYVKFPKEGLARSAEDLGKRMHIDWRNFDAGFVPECFARTYRDLSKKTSIEVSQINHFCMSQFALSMLKGCVRELDESIIDKFIYIGDKYGYTGTTSPYVALYEGIKTGRIKRGDIISLWSVGLLYTCGNIYLKY